MMQCAVIWSWYITHLQAWLCSVQSLCSELIVMCGSMCSVQCAVNWSWYARPGGHPQPASVAAPRRPTLKCTATLQSHIAHCTTVHYNILVALMNYCTEMHFKLHTGHKLLHEYIHCMWRYAHNAKIPLCSASGSLWMTCSDAKPTPGGRWPT